MADASRDEVIEWCWENRCDFMNPIFPPPSGWMWVKSDEDDWLYLTAIFTLNGDTRDVDRWDVYD
jgi:hypothetical protein